MFSWTGKCTCRRVLLKRMFEKSYVMTSKFKWLVFLDNYFYALRIVSIHLWSNFSQIHHLANSSQLHHWDNSSQLHHWDNSSQLHHWDNSSQLHHPTNSSQVHHQVDCNWLHHWINSSLGQVVLQISCPFQAGPALTRAAMVVFIFTWLFKLLKCHPEDKLSKWSRANF